MSFSRSGNPGPGFSYPVGTGVFTDVLVSNTVFSVYFRGDGGFLSNVNSSIPGTLPNLVVSNSLPTTNVFATIYRGDGGLLTNVTATSVVISGNTLSNLNASNLAFGVVNPSLILGNTLSNLQFSNLTGFQSNTSSNLNASNLAFGVVSSTLLYGNTISNINSANIVGTVGTAQSVTLASQTNITSVGTLTGLTVSGLLAASNGSAISNINSANITQPFANLVVSNTVTTTNVVAAGFTSNASNTIFNYSTLTVPFVTATTLNVSSTSNLSSTFISSANVSGTSNLGSTFITSANVSGTSNLAATFMKSSNISGTSNLATTVITSANVSGTSNMVGAVTVMGGLTTSTTSTSVFNGPLNFNSTFSPGVLAGNIRNILQGSSSVASVSPGPVNGTVTFGVTLTGTSYAIFFQPRYGASQTIFSITANTATTTTCSFFAYRITGSGSTCTYDWMLIDYNP